MGVWINRILTISGVRSIGIKIYIGNDFVKDEYSRSNRFVIFIANDRSFNIIKEIFTYIFLNTYENNLIQV